MVLGSDLNSSVSECGAAAGSFEHIFGAHKILGNF
jgi:hypothetical protein